MPRSTCALAVLLLLLSAVAIEGRAQVLPSSRIARPAAAPMLGHQELLEGLGERAAAEPIPGQYFAALSGGVVGLVGGTALGLLVAAGDEASHPERTLLVAGAVGWLGGTTYALHRFSSVKGSPGKPVAALGGAVLGLVGGPVAILTVPLGARWAYNRTRTGAAP